MSLDADHYRALYADKSVEDLAGLFGAATCGCVAKTHTFLRQTLTFAQMVRHGPVRGWPQCPICRGEGIDPRILTGMAEGVTALRAAVAACR